MDMFALDDEVARLELALSPLRGPGRLALLEPLAWYLRRRDTMRALALADEVETLFASSPSELDSNPDRQRIAARLRLVRGEASWMLAKLDAAQALTDPALQMFSALDDAAGSADAHWLLALIAADRGDHARRDAELEAAASQARRAGDDMRARIAEAALAIWSAPNSAGARASRRSWRICIRLSHPGFTIFWGWWRRNRAISELRRRTSYALVTPRWPPGRCGARSTPPPMSAVALPT